MTKSFHIDYQDMNQLIKWIMLWIYLCIFLAGFYPERATIERGQKEFALLFIMTEYYHGNYF